MKTREERQVQFMIWVSELEEKLALFIFENSQKIMPATEMPEAKEEKKPSRVEVLPIIKGDQDGWCVKVNGQPTNFFYGARAQQRASFKANQILNDGL